MNSSSRTTLFSFVVTALFLLSSCIAQALGAPPILPNGSFEQPTQNWQLGAMSARSQEQAATGQYSLKVTDADDKTGSDALSARIPIEEGVYTLRGQVLPVSGTGVGIYLRFLDASGKVGPEESHVFQRTLPSSPTNHWLPFELTGIALKNVAFAEVWIHSYN